MVSIPSNEPLELNAGDTWQWTRDFSDYPSSLWALTYYFRHPDVEEVKSFTGTADGADGFAITVAATATVAYVPGRWSWTARVSYLTTVTTVDRGLVQIHADYADDRNDHRSYNERCLDAIEAVIENRANTDQASWSIEGRSVSRMSIDELWSMRRRFKDAVAREKGMRVGRSVIRM